jgi:predicted GTPase
MRHTALLDSSLKMTHNMFVATSRGDINLVNFEADNRERVINILEKFQTEIENMLATLKAEEVSQEIVEIIKAWQVDVNNWATEVDAIDAKSFEVLEAQKLETTKEIATIFTSRQQFKGYNLNNTKK